MSFKKKCKGVYVFIYMHVCTPVCKCVHETTHRIKETYFLCSLCAFAQSPSNLSDATMGRNSLDSFLFGG